MDISDPVRYAKHNRYNVYFYGTTIVTSTAKASVVRKWIHSVIKHYGRYSYNQRLIVGLCIQWTYDRIDEGADTLQLCVGRQCLIFQLAHCDSIPTILCEFLGNPEFTFVGIWNRQDEEMLLRRNKRLRVRMLYDIRLFSRTDEGYGVRNRSTGEIAEECLGYRGFELNREISMSDWYVGELSVGQIMQCSIKVRICFELGLRCRDQSLI